MTTTRSCSKYETLSEEELTDCVKGGDEGACEELFRRYLKPCRRWSQAISRDYQDIDGDDLAQETLLRAYKNFGSYDPGRGAFGAWLYGITRHTLATMIRDKHARLRRHEGGAGGAAQGQIQEVQNLPAEELENIPDGKDWRKTEETAWLLSRMASGAGEQPEANVRRTILDIIGEAIDKLPPRTRDLVRIKFLYYPDGIPSGELDKLEVAFGMTRDNIRQTNYRAVDWIKRYVLAKYRPDGPDSPEDNLTPH